MLSPGRAVVGCGVLLLLFGLLVQPGGCRSGSLAPVELEGGAEIAVRRGSGWTVLRVKPPYIIGPRTQLQLSRGVFIGNIDGRGVRIKVENESAHGFGPYGPVAIDIADGENELLVEGQWSGSRVVFKVTGSAFRGTIPVFTGGDIGSTIWCQYVLDTIEPDGAWSGVSTCFNLPEETRLEVPESVQRWLTRAELTVVMLALLSSPPTTTMEQRRF